MHFPKGVANFFVDAFEAAAFESGATVGFFLGDAGGDVIGDSSLEVGAQFFVELVFAAELVKEAMEPTHDGPEGPRVIYRLRRNLIVSDAFDDPPTQRV